jgi:hypothetical protein
LKQTNGLAIVSSAVMATVMLFGCGAEPGSTQVRPTHTSAPAEPQPPVGIPPSAQQPGGTNGTNGDVDGLLLGIRTARQNVTGFTGTVVTYEDGPKGKISETLKIAFKKPSTLKIQVTQSTGGNAGTQLLWEGGDACKVKPGYLPFAVSIKMSDDRLLSKNGWEIRETEVNSILKILLDPSSRLKALGPGQFDGRPLNMLELVSPLTPKGGAKETIGIDPKTNLPGVRMIYNASGKMIYRLNIKQLTMKVPSSNELSI